MLISDSHGSAATRLPVSSTATVFPIPNETLKASKLLANWSTLTVVTLGPKAATLMLANGEHPKIVQERLGHSDISLTLNRYSHVSMDMQREAADRLETALHG